MKAIYLIGLIVLLVWGCHSATSFSSSPNALVSPSNRQEPPMINPIQSENSVDFIPGAPIKPSEQLLTWLNTEAQSEAGSSKRLRLPVVIYFEDSYRLALGDAFIGVSPEDRGDNVISLCLDDSSMGESLLSTLQDLCPKTETSCAVWLDGYWGSMLDLDIPELASLRSDPSEADDQEWDFSVFKVHGLIEQGSGSNEDIRVLIESPDQ